MTPGLVTRPEPGVWSSTWKLLKLRWKISFNSFKRSRLIVKLLTVISILAWLAFVGGVFFVSWKLVGLLRSPTLKTYLPEAEAFGNLINMIPVLLMMVAFLGILLTSFGGLLQSLYLAGDMDFLLSAPVPMRSVFASKLLQTVLPNFSFLTSIGLPVLYGLGIAGDYNLLYYLFVPVVMVAVTLSAGGIAGLLVIAVARIFPARRVAEVLGFFVAIFSVLCSQLGNFMRFGENEFTAAQFGSSIQVFSQFNTPWFPLTWAGRGLAALGAGQWLPGIAFLGLTLILSAGLFGLVLVTAERMYYTGWANMQVVARRRKNGRPRLMPAMAAQQTISRPSFLIRLIPGPVRAIVWKDFLVLRRDLRHLSQVITPLIFGVLYAFMLFRPDSSSSPDIGQKADLFLGSFQPMMEHANVALVIMVGWMLMNRLASMSFSQEGKDYWVLKVAPLSAAKLLTAKFIVAYLPVLALSCVYLFVISLIQGVSFFVLFYNLVIVAFCLAGMDGILLCFGAVGANLKWEDPRKMNSGNWGCLGMILAPMFTFLALGLFLGPLLLMTLLEIPLLFGYLLGLLMGGGLSVMVAIVPLILCRKKVERLGEA